MSRVILNVVKNLAKSLAKSLRGILDFGPFGFTAKADAFGRRPKGSAATLCQDDTKATTFILLDNSYIIAETKKKVHAAVQLGCL